MGDFNSVNVISSKPVVLVMCDWFSPGFKAGGPIRSVVNFVDNLHSALDIYVLTSDRDLGDENSYPGISTNQWIDTLTFRIFYASPSWLKWKNIRKIIEQTKPDFLYLNSMFSVKFTLMPLLMNLQSSLPNLRIILSPRGMLRSSALAHKQFKKTVFLRLFNILKINKKIIFHATDATEFADIKRIFLRHAGLKEIGNLPGVQLPFRPPGNKVPGFLKMIFVGRVHPIKNLDYVLNCLTEQKEKIELTIVAAIDDLIYWEKCKVLINSLPSNISIQLYENLAHHLLEEIMEAQHAFILPTKGENYGHAIYEALAAGRPVIISDQTPWRLLEQSKAGFDLPLNEMNGFIRAIDKFASMNKEEFTEWCSGAWYYCNEKTERTTLIEKYKSLFERKKINSDNQA